MAGERKGGTRGQRAVEAFGSVAGRLAVSAGLVCAGTVVSLVGGGAASAGGTFLNGLTQLFGAFLSSFGTNTGSAELHALASGLGREGRALQNHDLTDLIGRALRRLVEEAGERLRDTDAGATARYRRLGAAVERSWASVSEGADAAMAGGSTESAWGERDLLALFRVSEAGFPPLLDGETWTALLAAVADDAEIAVSPSECLALAERLTRGGARAIYEFLKSDFATGGRAFAGLALQTLAELATSAARTGRGVDDIRDRLDVARAFAWAEADRAAHRGFRTTMRLLDVEDGVRRLHEDFDGLRAEIRGRANRFLVRVRRAAPRLLPALADGLLRRLVGSRLAVDGGAIRLDLRCPRAGATAISPFEARNRRAAFVGRDAELDALLAWLERPAAGPVSIRVVTGRAGSGKTRLALELCAVARRIGWRAGFADGGALQEYLARAPAGAPWDRPTLVVIDYAATCVGPLDALLRDLERRDLAPDTPGMRILVLERQGDASTPWWRRVLLPDTDPLAVWYDPAADIVLGPLDADASGTLAQRCGASDVDALLGPLPAEDRTPLLIQLACELVQELGDGPRRRDRIVDAWLARDRRYRLTPILVRATLAGWADVAELAVGLITLVGHDVGMSEVRELCAAAGTAVHGCGDVPAALPGLLADYLGGPSGAVAPLVPDLLGERWVARVLRDAAGERRLRLLRATLDVDPVGPAAFLARVARDATDGGWALDALEDAVAAGVLEDDGVQAAVVHLEARTPASGARRLLAAVIARRRSDRAAAASDLLSTLALADALERGADYEERAGDRAVAIQWLGEATEIRRARAPGTRGRVARARTRGLERLATWELAGKRPTTALVHAAEALNRLLDDLDAGESDDGSALRRVASLYVRCVDAADGAHDSDLICRVARHVPPV